MASDSTGGASTRLERFDGSDPSLYKRWRRRAALMIISLPNTYPAEKYGPKLIEFLAGEAELAVEHIPVEDLAKSGGERLVFKALDERFRPLEKDDMNEALKEFFFETAIRSGEPMKAFITRFVTVERKLREQGVTLPDEVQGWFMLRKLHLDTNQEAMILTATRGSFKIGDVSQAVRAILANTKGTHKTNQKDTFVVTDEQDRDTDVGWDEDQELLQVLAAELQENDNYEEEELLDTFESYKQVRTKMQEVRKARGFRSDASSSGSSQPWRLQGTISARLQQVKARTRCHRCGQVGHWRKECPSRSGGKGSNKGSASSVTSQTSSKEVHIVEADWPTQEDYDLLLDQTASEIELGLDAFMIQGGGESDDSQRSVMLDPWSAPVPLIFREQCSTALGPSTVMNDVQHVHFEVFHEDDDQGVVEYTAAALETHGIPDTACRRIAMSYTGSPDRMSPGSHQLLESLQMGHLMPMDQHLDQQYDSEDDSPRHPQASGDTVMMEGKFKTKPRAPANTFRYIYTCQKNYTGWVRSHIGESSSQHLRTFKAYVEMRDNKKIQRLNQVSQRNGREINFHASGIVQGCRPDGGVSAAYTVQQYVVPPLPQRQSHQRERDSMSQMSQSVQSWQMAHAAPCSSFSPPGMTPAPKRSEGAMNMSRRRRMRDDDMEVENQRHQELQEYWTLWTMEQLNKNEEAREHVEKEITWMQNTSGGPQKV
ncbi:Uncharacterized protein SCF082_LOCUS5703, partial [Durusdinium trenchii]